MAFFFPRQREARREHFMICKEAWLPLRQATDLMYKHLSCLGNHLRIRTFFPLQFLIPPLCTRSCFHHTCIVHIHLLQTKLQESVWSFVTGTEFLSTAPALPDIKALQPVQNPAVSKPSFCKCLMQLSWVVHGSVLKERIIVLLKTLMINVTLNNCVSLL